MSKKPNKKRLNESQRCEIIAKLSKTDAHSKKTIAREYDVSEGAIIKVREKREQILERPALMPDEDKEKIFRSSIGRFTELEDMLYIGIDSMRCANLHVLPSLAIAKVKSIASSLSIPETDFKASWQWQVDIRVRRGLQKMLPHIEELKSTIPILDCRQLSTTSTRLLPNMILKTSKIWTRLAYFFVYFRDTTF